MAVKWRVVGNHALASAWHWMFVPLYLGALIFHALSGIQHYQDIEKDS